ncbi:N-acetyltransferase [Balneolaceae bacterium YR4-1]|uniref:N-acetyltransferase n=1 Tax=Halalkalibaculum roseum TaxID=2709311 RepID=A0A6M1T544_9BACT|nr:N-acetyltransferase [Halalkalibaculum roseum]NGP75463.1 N-acetyltransferase [Halalkalibaculum roseum]
MNSSIHIRPEHKEDIKHISQIIEAAFKDHPHGSHKEHLLVDELRADKALSLSLVAELDGEIVGHIAFSKVTIGGEFDSWYGLAPVSVDPDFQQQGIGSRLIEYGLSELRKREANGCVLVGEPGFYKRFGFEHLDDLIYEGVPDKYFLVLPFTKKIPKGRVRYHNLFETYG